MAWELINIEREEMAIMKRIKNNYLLAVCMWGCLYSVFLFCSCSGEVGEDSGIVFRLQLPPSLEVQSRNGTLGGITISDVWVAQFDAATKSLIQCHNFSGDAISGEKPNQTIEVATSNFSKISSNFYIIANAGVDFLTSFSGTENDLKALTKEITTSLQYDLNVLTSEPRPYQPTGDKVVLVAPLKRAYAKVSLKWDAPAQVKPLITITSVNVTNRPKKMAVYTRGGGGLNTPYPSIATAEIAAGNFITTETPATSAALPATTPCVFYMGENLRGMGSGTAFAEKNLPAKGPGGKLDYCTYVVMKGEYKYSSASAPIKVDYKIYLGGNLMNDYNIQRGMFYDMTLYINGANSADVRVTITDGNVIVFDKVVEITNTVEF